MTFLRTRLGVLVLLAGIIFGSFAITSCTKTPVSLNGRLGHADGTPYGAGTQVRAYSSTSEVLVATSVTDGNGRFSFPAGDLPSGTYRVEFGTSVWWSGPGSPHTEATTWAGASPIAVDTSSSTPVSLDERVDGIAGGSIAGTVSMGTTTGDPASTVVTARSVIDEHFSVSTHAGSDGTYLLHVPAGRYLVRFTDDPNSSNTHAHQYWHDATTGSGATAIDVVDGQVVTGIDATEGTASTVILHIDPQGVTEPSKLVGVAYDATSGEQVDFGTLDDNGVVAISHLPAGSYRFVIFDFGGHLQPAVWDTSSHLVQDGTPVAIATGTTTELGPLSFLGKDCSDDLMSMDHPGANLAGADLANCYLSNIDLSGADFTGADLSGAQLSDSRLTGTVFAHASLRGAHLERNPADDADFSYADLSGVDFYMGTEYRANFSHVVTDSGSKLRYLSLIGANVTDANLGAADLTGTSTAHLVGSPVSLPAHWSLIRQYLIGPGATLSDADLSHLDFSGADLTDVWFTNADLTGTDFTGADLSYGHFDASTFTGTVLSGTNLSYASLAYVDLASSVGTPTGGSTAHFESTVCQDGTIADFPATCVGRGFDA